tara:strand:- start:72 stop:1268 length:1197 start_codon:yes stop_codon:yes gene_type:complete
MKNYLRLVSLSFLERISFAIGRTLFTVGIIFFYGYEINAQFSAFWSLIAIVSTFFLFGLDTILITYSKNENSNFGYIGKSELDKIVIIFLCIGSFLSAFISFGIFSTYENILNINFLYFFISSFAFLSINILGNLFKGYEKFNFLIYINIFSFSISIFYLIFNTEGDNFIVFNTWLIFCILTIILNFLIYLFIRKQIPDKSKDIDNLFSQSFQKYIYRLVYQLAIRADILIVYNLVDKQTSGYYATARLFGDIVGYIHQGLYPILVSRRPKENSSEFLIPKVFILLIGISGFLLINLLNPFLNSYFSGELIKFASYTIFGSSIFNLIIFKSAEVIGENKVPLSVIFLTINTLCIFILFYVFDINLGLKFLLSQIMTITIIYFINDKIFFGLISKNKNK